MKKLFIIFALFVSSSCTVTGEILVATTNSKYDISVIFYGQKIPASKGGKVVKTFHVVEKVIIKDGKSGKEVVYEPEDAESLSINQAWFTDVWSPDKEYLLLPVGRFKGFGVYRASSAFNQISGNKPEKFIRLRQKDLPSALVHKFIGWEAPNTLVFSVGLSGRPEQVKYNIDKSTLVLGSKFFRNVIPDKKD